MVSELFNRLLQEARDREKHVIIMTQWLWTSPYSLRNLPKAVPVAEALLAVDQDFELEMEDLYLRYEHWCRPQYTDSPSHASIVAFLAANGILAVLPPPPTEDESE